ncbi:CubicO group peptidase (beta-lactamase class C family) [Nakamurella sp. UYEF19]|uniref:serine hydrolase domain-containing protein n=1 Tax=Nakamurella sp. UYEF19 TaxID=1756392 RepID=UPI0033969422
MEHLRGTGEQLLDDAVGAIRGLPGGPPGVVVATSSGGRMRWSAAGWAQKFDDRGLIAEPPPIDVDTATDLGSVTKLVATTAALMVLFDRGELDLTAPLTELLPWVGGTPVAGATVRRLLEHRGGLWEWWPTYLEPENALGLIADLPLRYRPDEARHYSDLGFLLLGAVVAELTGGTLDDAVGRLVLEPIGLPHTRYAGPTPGSVVAASSSGDRIEREMVRTGVPYPVPLSGEGFPGWRDHVLVGEVNDGNAFHSFGSVAGHAGLFSTARDLLAFGDAVLHSLDGGGFVSAATARRFNDPGSDPTQALGGRIWSARGRKAWGHTGFPGVALAILPDLATSVVLVTNRLHVAGTPVPTEPSWTHVLDVVADIVAQEGDPA